MKDNVDSVPIPRPGKKQVCLLVGGVILASGMGGCLLANPAYEEVPVLLAYCSAPRNHWLGLAGLVALAMLLYALRLWRRGLYAALELVFGFASAKYAFYQVHEGGAAKWTAIVASGYIIVRGLDNLHESFGKPFARPTRRE